MSVRRTAIVTLAGALLFCGPGLYAAVAGTTGTLTGVAVDRASGSPLAGAKVTVSGPSALESMTTDKTGHFTFAALPPDTYTVTLEASGHAASSVNNVQIMADNSLDLTLSADTSAAQ